MFNILNHKIAERGYYINLDKSIDRKLRVEEQIEKYKITGLERFAALTDPWHQYSCTKSHLAILQKCFDENIETVMIFEDDFQIYDECKFAHHILNFNECLSNVVNDLNLIDWDVILFGCNPRTYLIPITNNLAINSKSTGAWAYLIKKKAYKYILDNLNYGRDLLAIDDFLPLLNQRGFTSLTTIPLTIHHGVNLISTLQPREPVNYNAMIEGNYYNYIYNYVTDINLTYETYSIERDLTIVITGRFTDDFISHLRYSLMSIPPTIEKCRFIIIYDILDHSASHNNIIQVYDYFKNRNKSINCDIRFSTENDTNNLLLELIKTKYFIHLDCGWVFLNNNIKFKEMINHLNNNENIDGFWFNHGQDSITNAPTIFRTSAYANNHNLQMYDENIMVTHMNHQESENPIIKDITNEFIKNNPLKTYD